MRNHNQNHKKNTFHSDSTPTDPFIVIDWCKKGLLMRKMRVLCRMHISKRGWMHDDDVTNWILVLLLIKRAKAKKLIPRRL